jgi:hypothetical protein
MSLTVPYRCSNELSIADATKRVSGPLVQLIARWCRRPLPPVLRLVGLSLTLVMIKLAKQVFLCASGIMRISGWSKELALALRTACHRRNLVFVSQNDEVALCHRADSLS